MRRGEDNVFMEVSYTPRMRRATRLRLVRVFRRGLGLILVAVLEQAPLPRGRVVPEPWPAVAALEEPDPHLPGLPVPLATCRLIVSRVSHRGR